MLNLLLINIFALFFGGCQMQEITAPPTGDEQIVLEHAAKNYSLAPADVKISEVKAENLSGVKQFYVEENKSQHRTYNYLVYNKQAYSSGTDGDLTRFLKDYDFIKKSNDAAQYLSLLRIFSLPKEINVADDEFLKNYQKEAAQFPQIQPPKLTKTDDGGAELVFFATPVSPFKPEKWTAKFGANGEIQISK